MSNGNGDNQMQLKGIKDSIERQFWYPEICLDMQARKQEKHVHQMLLIIT